MFLMSQNNREIRAHDKVFLNSSGRLCKDMFSAVAHSKNAL